MPGVHAADVGMALSVDAVDVLGTAAFGRGIASRSQKRKTAVRHSSVARDSAQASGSDVAGKPSRTPNQVLQDARRLPRDKHRAIAGSTSGSSASLYR